MTKFDLDKDPISKLLFNFSFPAIMGMLISAFYMVVDGLFVGHGVGPDGLGSVNIAYPVIMLGTSASMMFGIGGSTIISVLKGSSGSQKEIGQYLTNMILLCVITYIVIISATYAFYEPIIYGLGSNENLFPMVKDYLLTLVCFLIFFMLSIALNAVVRNDRAPTYAMSSMLVGAAVNISLDWLFIIEYEMGTHGAALATGIAQAASFLFLVGHFFRKKCTIRPAITGLIPGHVKRIVSNGFPSFVMEYAFALVLIAFNNVLIVSMGEVGVSAFGAICYVFYVFIMIFTGLAQGLQPVVSYNVGAQHWARVKETQKRALQAACGIAGLILLLVMTNGDMMIAAFGGDAEIIAVGERGLMIYTSAIVFLGINFVNIAFMQAMERPRVSNILSILRSTVFVLLGLAVLPRLFGNDGIWMAMPFSDLMTFGVYLVIRHL